MPESCRRKSRRYASRLSGAAAAPDPRSAWQAARQRGLGSLFERTPRRESPSADVEAEHSDGNQKRTAPSKHLPVGVGAHRKLKDDDRQIGHRRVEVRAPELVVERGKEQ